MLDGLDDRADRTRPSSALAVVAAIVMVGLMAVLRLGVSGQYMLPIGYGVPVVAIAWFRDRKLLWATAAAFAVLTTIKFFWVLPADVGPHLYSAVYDRIAGGMVLADLFLVALLGDLWVISAAAAEQRNAELALANADLARREEEIAAQNEELQSQAEELQRQREELALSNEELSRREKTLEALLLLSRSLTTELSRGDMMGRICDTLGMLVEGPNAAAAILELEGDHLVVRCHHGFGGDGLEVNRIPQNEAFGSLVLARARTGYLEDMGTRPDLRIPQPGSGARMVAVLAAPLRVGGYSVGTLEVYSTRKSAWSDELIGLVESLAAQTSVSLEAAQLFETVRRERHRFETVLRTVPFGVAVANAGGSDVRLNPAGAALLNVPADQNVADDGAPLWTLYQNGEPLPIDRYPLARALSGDEVPAEELEVTLVNNRRLVLLSNARPIRDGDGKVQGAVAAFADITPQKELQRELDVRRREAEEASVRKTRFLAAVSHDIRTPANAISLLAELIRRTAGNPAMVADIPELARELQASASSLVHLLGDVLDLARFDSGKIELQESEFDLSELLAEENRHMQPLAREKGVLLEVVTAGPLLLRSDRIKIARVLGNLVGNAIKFTEKGSVRVQAARIEGGVKISISDTGVGIPPEHQRHIFDEFFQLRNPERDRNKGSGLGLTICRRLVDALGGTLDFQSEVGVGSTFSVTLPVSVLEQQNESTNGPSLRSQPGVEAL